VFVACFAFCTVPTAEAHCNLQCFVAFESQTSSETCDKTALFLSFKNVAGKPGSVEKAFPHLVEGFLLFLGSPEGWRLGVWGAGGAKL
jgi:hypothetical protein